MLHISASVQSKHRVKTSVREQDLSLWAEANEHSESTMRTAPLPFKTY